MLQRHGQPLPRRQQLRVTHVMSEAALDALTPATSQDFTFGKNWAGFLSVATFQNVWEACHDLPDWLGEGTISGRHVLDLGSGSGLHSLCFVLYGAASVLSVDYDEDAMLTTQRLRDRFGISGDTWRCVQGSALDDRWLASLGVFDIVYSWGVLHHTGSMWAGIRNAAARVARGGFFFLSLYTWHIAWRSRDLVQKHEFKAARTQEERLEILNKDAPSRASLMAMHTTVARGGRGMNLLHNAIDWLGGLPYEVARAADVRKLLEGRGEFVEEKSQDYAEGRPGFCNIFFFRRYTGR